MVNIQGILHDDIDMQDLEFSLDAVVFGTCSFTISEDRIIIDIADDLREACENVFTSFNIELVTEQTMDTL